jgi:adenylate kinase family enzyme
MGLPGSGKTTLAERVRALVREVAERFEPVSPEAERLDMRANPERLARELRALIDHARGTPIGPLASLWRRCTSAGVR